MPFRPTMAGAISFLPPDDTGLLSDHEGYPRAVGETLWVEVDGVSMTLGDWLSSLSTNGAAAVFNALFPGAIASTFASLPSVEPVAAGALWNNGRVVCITDGGVVEGDTDLYPPNLVVLFNALFPMALANAVINLPTAQPIPAGMLWNNGGVMCIS